MDADGDVGLFLPCNGVIYEKNDKIRVALTNADAMFEMIDNSNIAPVASEVSKIFNEVKEELEKSFM